MGVDLHALSGNAVQAVLAEHLIKGVVDVEPADVSVAGPAEVIRLHVMIGDRADWRGPRDETVFVVMAAIVVEVSQETELAGVTFPNQILSENVRDVNLLLAPAELVEVRVSVFLEHVEGGDVVLPAVVVVIAENTNAQVGVVENETAEIAHERLNAGAHGNEIVVVRQIAQMNFGERLLQSIEFPFASRPVLRIRIDDVSLLHGDVVMIVNSEKAQRPIDRLEGGLAFEKIDTDGKIVRVKKLIAQPEEFRTVRASCAHATRRRKFARFELKEIFCRDVEENVLAVNRRVAFEQTLQIGMPKF